MITRLAPSGVTIFKVPFFRVLILACTVTLSGCASLLFYPLKNWVATPQDFGVPYEDIFLDQGALRLHGWWLPAQGEARASLYFLHGNAENISTHMHSVLWLPAEGYNVFLLDYRGYGKSTGEPDLPGVIDDVRRGYQWLRERAPQAPIVVLGQSLGGGLAGYAMATQSVKPDAMVLDAAVASYPRIAGEVARRNWVTWALAPLATRLMPRSFDFIDVVEGLAGVPQLYLHSPQDAVVDIGHSQALFQQAAEPKRFVQTSGPHISTFADSRYRQLLLNFMEGLSPDLNR